MLILCNFKVNGRIGGVMVSVLVSSALNHMFDHRFGQTKAIKLVIAASPQSTSH